MRRSSLALAGVTALVLTACAAQGGNGGNTPVVNVNGTGAGTTGITVTGTGEVTGTPDTVEVNLGVSVIAPTVQEAAASATEKADALIATLTDGGIDRQDITTTDYSIYPEYDYSANSQTLVGYRVTNTVRVKIHDIGSAGSVIDDATQAAGDAVTVNGLQFSIDDDTELVEAAREAAWADAMAKATQLAGLSGQTLGAAVSISETVTSQPPPVYYERAMATDAGGAPPIEPGTSAVTITLQVNFAFEA